MRLINLFPFAGMNEPLVNHYNELAQYEIERIRDFVVHALPLQPARRRAVLEGMPRDGDPRIAARARRAVPPGRPHLQRDGELFTVDSWISVMMGQHIEPET